MTTPRTTPSAARAAHAEAAARLRELMGDSLVRLAAESALAEMEACAAELEAEADRLAGHLSDDEREDGQ
jgi:hypothetical protein